MVERYSSGSSLQKTRKEEYLDSLEAALWAEFSDETYVQLKKLPISVIKELHQALQERIAGTHEQEAEKKKK